MTTRNLEKNGSWQPNLQLTNLSSSSHDCRTFLLNHTPICCLCFVQVRKTFLQTSVSKARTDKLSLIAIETLCEVVIRNPSVALEVPVIPVIVDAAVDPAFQRKTHSVPSPLPNKKNPGGGGKKVFDGF